MALPAFFALSLSSLEISLLAPNYTMQDPGPDTLPVASVPTGISGIYTRSSFALFLDWSDLYSFLPSQRTPNMTLIEIARVVIPYLSACRFAISHS